MSRWKNGLQTSDEIFNIKRAAVLREATRIISRKGFHDTSLDDIAAALQVSKGTLYNYISDKQEILLECHKMALDIGDQAFAFADKHGTNGYAKIRLMLRAYLTWLNGALGGGGVAGDVTALRPADRKLVLARRDYTEQRLTAYFKEGFADGTVRRVDTKLAIFTIMGAVNSVQTWYSPGGRLSAEEIADTTIDILMHGIDTEIDAAYRDEPVPLLGTLPVTKPDSQSHREPKKRKPGMKAAKKSGKRQDTPEPATGLQRRRRSPA